MWIALSSKTSRIIISYSAHLSELGRIVLQHLDDLKERTDRRLLPEPKMMDAEQKHNPLLQRRIVRH